MLKNLVGWCHYQDELQQTNARLLHTALQEAIQTEELSIEAERQACFLMGEWNCLTSATFSAVEYAAHYLNNDATKPVGA